MHLGDLGIFGCFKGCNFTNLKAELLWAGVRAEAASGEWGEGLGMVPRVWWGRKWPQGGWERAKDGDWDHLEFMELLGLEKPLELPVPPCPALPRPPLPESPGATSRWL